MNFTNTAYKKRKLFCTHTSYPQNIENRRVSTFFRHWRAPLKVNNDGQRPPYTRKRFPAFLYCLLFSRESRTTQLIMFQNTKTQENVSVCTGPELPYRYKHAKTSRMSVSYLQFHISIRNCLLRCRLKWTTQKDLTFVLHAILMRIRIRARIRIRPSSLFKKLCARNTLKLAY